jgi:hypothetical protein
MPHAPKNGLGSILSVFFKEAETQKSTIKIDFKILIAKNNWSGQRESNPHYQLGRLE